MSNQQYSELRWGIAGAGAISEHFVAAVKVDSPPGHHKFIGVASRTLATAQKFATKFQVPNAYASYEELAANADVQIVYIGNLNPDHYATAKLFLEHGKHVLLEKPLTMNAKETEAITAFAKQKGLFLMEALWSRFLPAYRFAVEQIKSGAIGEVTSVDVSFGLPIADVDRIKRKALGGGTVLDLGVYTLNVVQLAFDNALPEKVVAVGEVNEEGVDLSVSAALLYSGGRSATLRTHSRVELPNEAVIIGTKGVVKLLKFMHCAQIVELNGERHDFSYGPNTPEMHFPSSRGLRFQADAVRQLLLDGQLESPIMPHHDSVNIAKIQDLLRAQLGVRFDADN